MNHAEFPLIIGLCGRSGAGKSFVSRLFGCEGVPYVDTDAVYREMTAPAKDGVLSDCMKELAEEFGDGILKDDLSLNRPALAEIVFADGAKDRLARLNEITHKHILAETDRKIECYAEEGRFAVIVDAPLLFESGYNEKCDYIVAASAPEDILVSRIMSRDGIDRDGALRRLKTQLSDEALRERADFVIETNENSEILRLRVKEILSQMAQRLKGNCE